MAVNASASAKPVKKDRALGILPTEASCISKSSRKVDDGKDADPDDVEKVPEEDRQH
jgi:hypothetical protein